MKDLKKFNDQIDQFNASVTYIIHKLNDVFGVDSHVDLVTTETPKSLFGSFMNYYLRSTTSDVEKTYASLLNILKSSNISVKLDHVNGLQDIYANVEKIKQHMDLYQKGVTLNG